MKTECLGEAFSVLDRAVLAAIMAALLVSGTRCTSGGSGGGSGGGGKDDGGSDETAVAADGRRREACAAEGMVVVRGKRRMEGRDASRARGLSTRTNNTSHASAAPRAPVVSLDRANTSIGKPGI